MQLGEQAVQFDDYTERMRWFLLPSEAWQWLQDPARAAADAKTAPPVPFQPLEYPRKKKSVTRLSKVYIFINIYTINLIESVCSSSQTAGRSSCSIVSGDVSNCSHRLKVLSLTGSRLSSAYTFFYLRKSCRNRVQRKCQLNEPASDPLVW